jgi:HEAT repeat protein
VVWKLSVLRALVEMDFVDAGRAIAALVGDADERVARYAARALVMRKGSEWRAVASLVISKSPHASVRRVGASLRPPSGSFEKVWRSYPKLPPAIQHSTTRTGAVEPQFGDQLRDKLGSAQPLEVAQGLKMLSALPELAPYRESIISLCGHADSRIAAIAVRLIGRLEDPRLKDLLDAAAKHEDPRVRANAVESMTVLHIADRSQQVLTMLNSRHNRERANAIKAISDYDFATARECLLRMLADPNPMHRISALWVVEQLHILGIVRQVSSIARKDPNTRVRRRATEMLATMTATMATA